MGRPPYGYQIDPLDKEHWILDEEAAPVVKRIFDLSIAGKGPCSIARMLEQDKVLTAKALYAQRKGKRRITQTKKRLDDLETLLTRCYEDMVLGTLSRERYLKLSQGYEAEQEQLQLELDVTEEWVEQQESLEQDLRQFMTLVDKYVAVPELTHTIVNEYIHKILVYAPEKTGRIRIQRVKIIFNFVDELDIPVVNQIITHEQPVGTNGKKKTA